MSAKIFCILKKKTCFSNQIETSMKFDLTLFSPCWTLTRVWVSDIRWQDLSDFSQLAFYNSPERPTAGKKLKWNIFSDKILIFFVFLETYKQISTFIRCLILLAVWILSGHVTRPQHFNGLPTLHIAQANNNLYFVLFAYLEANKAIKPYLHVVVTI